MIIYRLATLQYGNDLSDQGAKLYGGRWNSVGTAALYSSEFISLSILEILVRASLFTAPDSYSLSTIEIPDSSITEIELKRLKYGWKNHMEYTQLIGDEFIKSNTSLTLKVPSAIIPQEHNFLINPSHKDFKKIKIVHFELLELDKRLFEK